jgi:Domain of unknown function (DUF3854)/AAA domain
MTLNPEHLAYLAERGLKAERLTDRYRSAGSDLCILYCDPQGNPYTDSKQQKYVVRRLFPTGTPKFKAPAASGSRPYFSPLMPEGYLDDIRIPLVLIEGPVKVDSCYEHIPTGYCFVGLTGTWNTKDRRDDQGVWNEENDTRTLPELKAIPMRGRQVIILFDSDIDDNISVDEAAGDIGNWTRQRGARPYRCTLPSESDGRKNGADDFLVRHGAAALEEQLEAAEIEGWPLPSPLLTHDGELKRSYTPAEEKRLIRAIVLVTDPFAVDKLVRAVHRRLGMSKAELLGKIENERDGLSERGLFFDPSELDTPDIHGRWILPGVLARGEVIIISGLGGTSKTFLAYGIGSACRRGASFLGMAVPKMRVCILQLEEAGSFGGRMRLFGFTKEEVCVTWNAIRSFNPLNPQHMQLLKAQVLPHYDLFILDSIREMSAGSGLNENQAEFSQQLIRPLVKLFRSTDKACICIDHNAKGSNALAGGEDKRAAVWGVFNLKKLNEQSDQQLSISSIQAHGGKARDAEAIHWEIHWEMVEEPEGDDDRVQWRLVSDLRPDCTDLNLLTRVLALLEQRSEPLALRAIAQRLGLPDGPDGKVNPALRKLASRNPALARYRDETTYPATFFMPLADRSEKKFPSTSSRVPMEPCSDTRGSQGSQGVPLAEKGTHDRAARVPQGSLKTPQNPNGNPETPCNDSRVPKPPESNKGETFFKPPTLNGHTAAVWAVINANPSATPFTLANLIAAKAGITLSPNQVKALLQAGPPSPPDDPLDF